MFQHTAARRRLVNQGISQNRIIMFQHTAARRRLAETAAATEEINMFQHTAARRRLAKALLLFTSIFCFNTQPPEGGWVIYQNKLLMQL